MKMKNIEPDKKNPLLENKRYVQVLPGTTWYNFIWNMSMNIRFLFWDIEYQLCTSDLCEIDKFIRSETSQFCFWKAQVTLGFSDFFVNVYFVD